jgi:hypothetical protein
MGPRMTGGYGWGWFMPILIDNILGVGYLRDSSVSTIYRIIR